MTDARAREPERAVEGRSEQVAHQPEAPALDPAAAAFLGLQAGGNQAVCRLADGGAGDGDRDEVFARIRGQLGRGERLGTGVRGGLESAMGADFGSVRVHRDAESADLAGQVGARAFTTGQDIFFGPGAYDPGSARGYETLAHELAHTVQQGDGVLPASGAEVSDPGDPSERAAEAVARQVTAGGQPTIKQESAPPVIHREPLPATPEAPAIEPKNRNRSIATWIGWVDSTVRTGGAVGTPKYGSPYATTPVPGPSGHYPTEEAAIAAVKADGGAGAVFVEDGQYVGYDANGDGLVYQFLFENVRWFDDKPWTGVRFDGNPPPNAIVTKDGVVLRAEHFKSKDEAKTAVADQAAMPGAGTSNAFAGYRQVIGDPNKSPLIESVFYPAMCDHALSVLAASRVQVERDVQRRSRPESIPPAEINKMRGVVDQLVALDKQIQEEAMNVATHPAVINQRSDNPMPTDEIIRGELRRLQAQRRAKVAEYPVLARISDMKAFAALTPDQQMSQLGGESTKIVADIDKTRNNVIDGSLKLWKISGLVDATIAGLGITDPQARKRMKDLAKANETNVDEIVQTVFAVALGIAAAFATGGLAVVLAAGAFGLGVADALRQTEEITAEHAAGNTALDPNNSLLPPEDVRSWGWLVLAWGGTILDGAQLVSAIKAVKAAGGAIEAGVKVLAPDNAKLAKELRLSAGVADATEVVTDAIRPGLANRLGASLEVDATMGRSVEVHYHKGPDGRPVLDVVKHGPDATVGVILAHEPVVRMLRRYEGLFGKLRELIDKMRSLAGFPAPGAAPPFKVKSQAYESYMEVMKLPQVIESRQAALGTVLGTEAEEVLRRDIAFLETELQHHQRVVEQMVAEEGVGFVAAAGEGTAKAIAEGMPDLAHSPLIKDPKAYYYRVNPGGKPPYTLVRFHNSAEPARTLVPDGSGWKIAEGALGRAEEAAAMMGSWSPKIREAFDLVISQHGGIRVVPLNGVSTAGKSIRQLMNAAEQREFLEIMTKVFQHAKDPDPLANATKAVNAVLDHEITVVKGTEQLRAYGYRSAFEKAAGKEASGDLHHTVPLYLGGDHRKLVDAPPELHDALHELLERVRFDPDTTLAPSSIQNTKSLNFAEGAAVLHNDGRVQLMRLNPDGTYTPVP